MKTILGGKGAGLAQMARAGLPVPPGFTISAEVCHIYFQNGNAVPSEIHSQMLEALAVLEARTGRRFGDAERPLLVSVRSGASVSMPGMMDTVLNVGLNDETAAALAARNPDPRVAYLCYRNFIEMYGGVVLGIPKRDFEAVLEEEGRRRAANGDAPPALEALKREVARCQELVLRKTGKPFPQNPLAQVEGARDAVFRSWHSERAIRYRKLHQVPDDLGTAVNVQQMAEADKSGVMFTVEPVQKRRDRMMIEAVFGLGEGLVSGLLTPDSYLVRRSDGAVLQEFIAVKSGAPPCVSATGGALEARAPGENSEVRVLSNRELDQLRLMGLRVEELFGSPQDIEWCIGGGALSLLQSRRITTL
jgi:pyruvate,orthophosphate dikinase